MDTLSSNLAAPLSMNLVLEPVGLRVEIQRSDVVIGRHSQADVRLGLPDVSRRHCRLVCDNGQWRVIDLASTNGVFVNGERVAEANLYDGDRLQLGNFTFRVEYAGAGKQLRPTLPMPEQKRLAS